MLKHASFLADNQTIRDLRLFKDKTNPDSVFSVYNKTKTSGGRSLLSVYFREPLADIDKLRTRLSEIEYLRYSGNKIELNSRVLDAIEFYLVNRRIPLKCGSFQMFADNIKRHIDPDSDFFIIREGITSIIDLLKQLLNYISLFDSSKILPSIIQRFRKVQELSEIIRPYLDFKGLNRFSYHDLAELDFHFRITNNTLVREILDIVYHIDILQSMVALVVNDSYTYPQYIENKEPVIEITDAFYPLLESPVKNSLYLKEESSLCFLTGPNMSGKSTFLRTIGQLIYIAHLGFPVPAAKMKISIFEGLFATINLNDDPVAGFSHFYSEVKRIKEVALVLSEGKSVVIMFDELFRGTNIKDAYEASTRLIESFSKLSGSIFIISSHLIELAVQFQNNSHITFKCFRSEISEEGNKFSYKINDGVSDERFGMKIIKDEGIVELLEAASKN